MKRHFLIRAGFAALLTWGACWVPVAHAAEEAPDVLIKRISTEVLESIRADKSFRTGDVTRVVSLVDAHIIPNFNFARMTSMAVGPAWRQATDQQKKQLQDEFKILLVRTYSGALSQVKDQTIVVKPLRSGAANEQDVVVRTEIRGDGDPIQVDYKLEKTPGEGSGWKVFNINVMGVWLVENYRAQFGQEISSKGIDGLIATLVERNKSNNKKG